MAVVFNTRAGVKAGVRVEVRAGLRPEVPVRVEERVGVGERVRPNTQKAEPILTNPTPRMSTGVPPVDDPLSDKVRGEGGEVIKR